MRFHGVFHFEDRWIEQIRIARGTSRAFDGNKTSTLKSILDGDREASAKLSIQLPLQEGDPAYF